VPFSNADNIGAHQTWTQSEFSTWQNSIRGAKTPKNVYIVYQPRRWSNIAQSAKGTEQEGKKNWKN